MVREDAKNAAKNVQAVRILLIYNSYFAYYHIIIGNTEEEMEEYAEIFENIEEYRADAKKGNRPKRKEEASDTDTDSETDTDTDTNTDDDTDHETDTDKDEEEEKENDNDDDEEEEEEEESEDRSYKKSKNLRANKRSSRKGGKPKHHH